MCHINASLKFTYRYKFSDWKQEHYWLVTKTREKEGELSGLGKFRVT